MTRPRLAASEVSGRHQIPVSRAPLRAYAGRLRRRHRGLRGPARLAARRNPRRQRPGPGRAADLIDPDLLAVHRRRRPAPHPAPSSRPGHQGSTVRVGGQLAPGGSRSVRALQADVLFVSALEHSNEPNARQILRAVVVALSAYRVAGCAEWVAQEFGDHPETAAVPMRWARATAAILESHPVRGRGRLPQPTSPLWAGTRRRDSRRSGRRYPLDYVVVGAGAVGCPLANRLPEDPDNQARLLGCFGSMELWSRAGR